MLKLKNVKKMEDDLNLDDDIEETAEENEDESLEKLAEEEEESEGGEANY